MYGQKYPFLTHFRHFLANDEKHGEIQDIVCNVKDKIHGRRSDKSGQYMGLMTVFCLYCRSKMQIFLHHSACDRYGIRIGKRRWNDGGKGECDMDEQNNGSSHSYDRTCGGIFYQLRKENRFT